MTSASYFYPGTDVLINYKDIREQSQLDAFERQATAYRAWELTSKPLPIHFDFAYLKGIHSTLFGDVYPFAGLVRTTNIGKNGHWFCDFNMIARQADYIFKQLQAESFLKHCSVDGFADRVAYFYSAINFMHPFREGNGRSIRIFFEQLSTNAGFDLDWSKISKEDYLKAIKETDDPQNILELTDVFRRCIEPLPSGDPTSVLHNKPPVFLKDILAQVKGMPSAYNQFKIDHQTLNQQVRKYKIQQNGQDRYLIFQLKGDDRLNKIKMEDFKYLSQETKDQWIKQAAENIRFTSFGKGYEK